MTAFFLIFENAFYILLSIALFLLLIYIIVGIISLIVEVFK